MKIKGLPGEFAFRALMKYSTGNKCLNKDENTYEWILTPYFFNEKEVKNYVGNSEYKWPAEVYEDGFVYIPSKEELNEE